jgi:hypothetical protein
LVHYQTSKVWSVSNLNSQGTKESRERRSDKNQHDYREWKSNPDFGLSHELGRQSRKTRQRHHNKQEVVVALKDTCGVIISATRNPTRKDNYFNYKTE